MSVDTNSRLKEIRREINKIDSQILALLNERARYSLEVGKLKKRK